MLHSLTEKSDSNVALLPECRGSVGGRHCGWGTWLRGTCSERGNMVEEHHWTETGKLYTESLRYSLIQKKKEIKLLNICGIDDIELCFMP